MIPLRIALQGFISYADRQELTFDGACLWALAGPNGAGKSSVFHAIVYALYGRTPHRTLGVDSMINHGCDDLCVEFDFRLGDVCYRIERTLSRRGRSSRLVSQLIGGLPQRLPETTSDDGFRKWIKRHIGLEYESFVMSAMLCQGDAEALLDADPVKRHTLLKNVVDLARYERLHDLAKNAAAREEARARAYKISLENLPPDNPVRRAALPGLLDAAQQARANADTRRLTLAAHKVHAEKWAGLCRLRDNQQARLADARAMIKECQTIRRDAARAQELAQVLPALTTIHTRRGEYAVQETLAARLRVDADAAMQEHTSARAAHAEAQAEVTQCDTRRQAANQTLLAATQRLAGLSKNLATLDAIDHLRSEIANAEAALAKFPADLATRAQEGESELQTLDALHAAQPVLNQYVKARAAWRQADGTLATAQAALATAQAAVASAAATANASSVTLQRAAAAKEAAATAEVAARTRHEVAQQAYMALHDLEGKPTCPVCGQALTEAHKVAEEGRRRADADAAAQAMVEAQAFSSASRAGWDAAQAEYDYAQTAHVAAERDVAAAQNALRNATDAQAQALADARYALDDLWARALPTLLLPAAALPDALHEAIPTEADLSTVQAAVDARQGARQAFDALRKDLVRLQEINAQLTFLRGQLAQHEVHFPPAHAQAVRADVARAQAEETQMKREIQDAEAALTLAQQEAARQKQAEAEADQCRQQSADLAKQAHLEAEKHNSAIEATRATLPAAWQAVADALTDASLAGLEDEQRDLAGAEERLNALANAEADLHATEQALAQIEADLDAIPSDARRPLEEIERDADEADADLATADANCAALEVEQHALETQANKRQHLTDEKRTADRLANQYSRIATQLGADYLQRYLLQSAEKEIVAKANRVLDACSAGQLRIALREASEGAKGAKAFDLIACNDATEARDVPVWALSGSQRFRVAIGLALGIGEYASANGRPVESVIIDEGFGSLDSDGLVAMADALHGLENTLQRIIVVSHQEQFATRFPHRYAVTLVDGASQVRLQGVDGES